MLRVPGTVDLLLFSAPFSAHSRSNLSIFASRDSGATWQFERTVDGRSAYSALIDINVSHYGVAWETGGSMFLNLLASTY